jgi:hypothetical protein
MDATNSPTPQSIFYVFNDLEDPDWEFGFRIRIQRQENEEKMHFLVFFVIFFN